MIKQMLFMNWLKKKTSWHINHKHEQIAYISVFETQINENASTSDTHIVFIIWALSYKYEVINISKWMFQLFCIFLETLKIIACMCGTDDELMNES